MSTKIQVRRGTAYEWASANPTLAAGEIGFETNTGKFKIGDGTLAWTSLLYVTDTTDFVGVLSAANGGTGNAYVDRTVIAQASSPATISGSATADVMTSVFQSSGTDKYVTLQASSSYYVEVFIPFSKAASASTSTFRMSVIYKNASTGADITPSGLYFPWNTVTSAGADLSGTIYATTASGNNGANSIVSVTNTSAGILNRYLRAVGYIFTGATVPKFTIGFAQSVAPSSGVPTVSNTYIAVYKLTTSSATMNGAWQS